MKSKMAVLAVGAHSDDLEILCGGTLAKFAKPGRRVVITRMLNGDKGHFRIPSANLAGILRREAMRSASLIGAEDIS